MATQISLRSFVQKLHQSVDNSPLVIFRMIFGLLIWAEAWGAIATGWVKRAFIIPEITFPFMAFSWLKPLPGDGMYYYYIVMGIFGAMIMLGLYYRVAVISYTIMWAGVYYMQKTNYNNHYYLLLLLLILMCLVPAHQYASLDARRTPKLKQISCPQWCLWIFAAQIAIVYFYGAVAKMYPGWVTLKPLETWFSQKADLPLVGGLLQKKWFQYFIAYGGIGYDLLIVPALIWKKTRRWAFGASLFFHVFNSLIFQVGIFPYLGISWALFFFEPETIRRIFLKQKPAATNYLLRPEEISISQKLLAYGLGLYVLVQILLPLRHHLFAGNVHWTEEGHRMSWQMMTRTKTGRISFIAYDPDTDKKWTISTKNLTLKQRRAVAARPDMCWQYVQILKANLIQEGHPKIEIYAKGTVQLNGEAPKKLYNPDVDLTKIVWKPFQHSDWLLPY